MKIDLYLNKLLSFTSLAVAWIVALSVKFYLYDLLGFNQYWIIKNPTFGDEFNRWFDLVLWDYGLILVLVAGILDYVLWPYFFRKESKEVMQIFASDNLE